MIWLVYWMLINKANMSMLSFCPKVSHQVDIQNIHESAILAKDIVSIR